MTPCVVAGWPALAAEQPLRVISDEADRVVLRLEAVPFVTEVDPEGRATLRVPGYGQIREPGRPVLPRTRALVAS